MNSADVEAVRVTSARVNRAVWGVAVGVMVYGTVNVTSLLLHHGVPQAVAWMLSLMVDLGLCVALWADRVLHQHDRKSGWLTVLRWITAAMTWALNVGESAQRMDWVGVGIHSCGPVLLVVTAEAAGAVQRHMTAIITDLTKPPAVDVAEPPRADRFAPTNQANQTAPAEWFTGSPTGSTPYRTAWPNQAENELGEPDRPAVASGANHTSHGSPLELVTADDGDPVPGCPDPALADVWPLALDLARACERDGRTVTKRALEAHIRAGGRTCSAARAMALLTALRSVEATPADPVSAREATATG